MISAATVTRMRREGVPNYKIAERLGVTSSAVSNLVRRLGLPKYSSGRKKDLARGAKIANLLKVGLNGAEIAGLLGCSDATVSRHTRGPTDRMKAYNGEKEMARHPIKAEPKKETPLFVRRVVTFYPGVWSKKMDDELFKMVLKSAEKTGCEYGAITEFAAKKNLGLDAVQGRWLLISKRA